MRSVSTPFRTTFISFYEKVSIIADDLRWLEYRLESTELIKTLFSINRINQNINFLLLCIKMFFGLIIRVKLQHSQTVLILVLFV